MVCNRRREFRFDLNYTVGAICQCCCTFISHSAASAFYHVHVRRRRLYIMFTNIACRMFCTCCQRYVRMSLAASGVWLCLSVCLLSQKLKTTDYEKLTVTHCLTIYGVLKSFLQRVRTAPNVDRCNSHGLSARMSVCLAVRLFVTFRCFVQTNEDTIVWFSELGRTITLVSGEVKFIPIFAGIGITPSQGKWSDPCS